MWHQALWTRDFRKCGWLVGVLILLMWLFETQSIIWEMESFPQNPLSQFFHIGLGEYKLILFGVVALMPVVLIGSERGNGGMENFLAFPLKRSDFFWSKWLFGAVFIFLVVLVNSIGITVGFFQSSLNGLVSFLPFVQYFGFNFLGLLTVFTFVMMLGMLTGTVLSHSVLGFVGMIFPIGFGYLIHLVFGMHYEWITGRIYFFGGFLGGLPLEILLRLTLISTLNYHLVLRTYLGITTLEFSGGFFWSMTIYLVLSLLIGYVLFLKNPMERNGNLILHEKWEPFIRWGVIVCTALLMGAIFGDDSPLIFYPVSLLIGTLLYFILKRFKRSEKYVA